MWHFALVESDQDEDYLIHYLGLLLMGMIFISSSQYHFPHFLFWKKLVLPSWNLLLLQMLLS